MASEGQQKPLHPLLRDDIYRMGREALMNAFLHSRAKNIEVELNCSPHHLRILVRDDGCGIDPHIIKSGRDRRFAGMRDRAEQMGARLRVYSSAAAGTKVELTVPGHVAFRDHSGRRLSWFGKRNPPTTAIPESAAGKGKAR